MNARRGTPAARTASPRVDGFAAAKTATATSTAIESNPVRMRRLQNVDCLVCFVFIDSYGRSRGVGRGRGVGLALGAGVGVGVGVGVGLTGVAVAVGVAVTVGVAVGVAVGVGPDCAQYLPPVLR